MAGRQYVFMHPFICVYALNARIFACRLGYSPLDFSVLDPHWGTLADWQAAVDAIHARGMYIMADFTVGTMGDLIGFKG